MSRSIASTYGAFVVRRMVSPRRKYIATNRQESAARCLGGTSGSSNGTYYDSQSGQHVPIHDERKVKAFRRVRNHSQSYDEMMNAAKALGLAGAILTLPQLHGGESAVQLLESLSVKTATEVCGHELLIHVPQSHQLPGAHLSIAHNINVCFEYSPSDVKSDETETETLRYNVDQAITNGLRTSIGIFDSTYINDMDPIYVASNVVNLIDTAPAGDTISYIILDPFFRETRGDIVNEDQLVRLCEELSYLDVPGPTIKSRLIVSFLNESVLEECLDIGISKYIVCDDDDGESLDMLVRAVEGQGKEIIRNI
jgi:hypothetical protein